MYRKRNIVSCISTTTCTVVGKWSYTPKFLLRRWLSCEVAIFLSPHVCVALRAYQILCEEIIG